MQDNKRQLVLLGPQPEYESLQTALEQKSLKGPVALITAGWETGEHEDGDLKRAIELPTTNLKLFARTEQLFKDDPELIQTLRTRQDELRHLRDAYNDRLDHRLKEQAIQKYCELEWEFSRTSCLYLTAKRD